MVRMSQAWKVRKMLVEMHGNNGSVDGDPPAAMRYTEARLSQVASEFFVISIKEQLILFRTSMIHHQSQLSCLQDFPTCL